MGLIGLLDAAMRIYSLVILARVIFSWLPPQHRETEIYRFLFAITEPVLRPIRRLLPATSGWDFSPIVALIVLQVIRRALLRALLQAAPLL